VAAAEVFVGVPLPELCELSRDLGLDEVFEAMAPAEAWEWRRSWSWVSVRVRVCSV